MDLFKIFLKRLFYKIPFKLLLVIVIVLFLSLITIGSDVFAVTTDEWQKYVTGKNYVENTLGKTIYGYCYGVNAENGHTVICYKTHSSNSSIWVNNSRTQVVTGGFCVIYDATSNSYTNLTGYSTTAFLKGNVPNCIYYTNTNIYTTGGDLVKSTNLIYEPFTNPFIINNSSDLENMSFGNLEINAGSETGRYTVIDNNVSYEYVRDFKLEIDYNGVTYTEDLRDYLSIDSNNVATFSIPKNVILSHFNVYNGQNISFSLYVNPSISPNSTGTWSIYGLGTYTLGLTTSEEEQINADSNKYIYDSINNSINETNSNIEELNNNITDSTIDNSSLTNQFENLGDGFVLTDSSGLDNLFTILYNAFCNNAVIDLTFTLPFVNKQVTINSSNISSNYPQQLVTIVHLFVWGTIGLYIIIDIRTMLNKTAEGNIENISSDVKKEVL